MNHDQRARIDDGLECPKCGTQDPEHIAQDDPCGIAIFRCMHCRCSWLDLREREAQPHLEPEWFEARAGI